MSPIKGLSEVVRLPRLGKIRLGIKVGYQNGIMYPAPTDYFVCTEEVRKVFGEKPRELRIMFPTENNEQWASQYLRCYSASGGLICRGDGENAVARVDVRTGEIATKDAASTQLREITCNPARCPYHHRDRCRRVMNLQFLIPECPGLGVYQLDTSSFHSIRNVNSALAFIRGIAEDRVSMIPLCLQLVEQEVQPGRSKKKAWVLNLTWQHTLADIQRYACIPRGQALILPPPDGEAPDDLFPEGVVKSGSQGEGNSDDDECVTFWNKAKVLIWRLDIQDYQITDFFQRNHGIDVRLKDFDLPLPPKMVTVVQLADFCRTVERYSPPV